MELTQNIQVTLRTLSTGVCRFSVIFLAWALCSVPQGSRAQCTPLFTAQDLKDSYYEKEWMYEGFKDLVTNSYPKAYTPFNNSRLHEFAIYFMGRLRKKSDGRVIGKFFHSEVEDKQVESFSKRIFLVNEAGQVIMSAQADDAYSMAIYDSCDQNVGRLGYDTNKRGRYAPLRLTVNYEGYVIDMNPAFGSLIDTFKLWGFHAAITAKRDTKTLMNLDLSLDRGKRSRWINKASYTLFDDHVSPVVPPMVSVLIQRKLSGY